LPFEGVPVIEAALVAGLMAMALLGLLWVRAARRARALAAEAAEATKLREMIDAIPIPVWRRDPDGTLADCNKAYAAVLGATSATVLAEGRELAPSGWGGRRHLVIDGSRRLLEIGEIAGRGGAAVGFAADRTEAESAETELWRHINAHAEVLESLGVAIAIYGTDKRLRFFNTAFAALWGIEEAWLAGAPLLDQVLDRLREGRRLPELADFRAFKRAQLRLFTALTEPLLEVQHLPDGRTLRLTISPHPLGGLIFACEDVTDRLALERSYNTLTQVQRATLDHLSEAIAVYGSDGRLKLHNPAYRALWGLTNRDLAGEPHIGEIVERTRALIDSDGDWPAVKEAAVAKVTARTLTSGPLYRRDGSVLQAATVPLPDGNVLLTYLDVSDTSRVERALREKNEALETAGRLKSEFIASVSHQLRTPLNAAIGFAEILTNGYFGSLNARQLEYSRGILASSHQLLALIDDIIDLASFEAGYLSLDKEQIEVADMLDAVIGLTRERAQSRGIALTLSCRPEIGAIEADGRRLKQALFNLISNAIKFTPPGGTIAVAAERSGNQLLLSVADTGIGIPAADQARALEKFEPGAKGAGGTGLGLSLVRTLVELHGGAVELASAPGRGTRVTCRLPSAPAAPAQPAPPLDAHPRQDQIAAE
jgi:signal transduction histidine kinase